MMMNLPILRHRCAMMAGLCFALASARLPADMTAARLRCEYLSNPRGVHHERPRLSWELESPDRGQSQTAYQILVASTPERLAADEGDLWDSGKVAGRQTAHVEYAGKPLASRMECHWKVRSWDRDGTATGWSGPASWTVGLLHPSDWTAKWIDASERPGPAGNHGTPVILAAGYQTLDGTVVQDVMSQVSRLGKAGVDEIQVENEALGGDPAFGKVKHLRISYQVDGRKCTRTFPEKVAVRFPADFPPPPEIRRAVYEAIDGNGSADVTAQVAALVAAGATEIPVTNEAMGSDPALNRKKRLAVQYEFAGETRRKTFDEDTAVRFPDDLLKPATVPYLRRTFEVRKPLARATLHATALGIYELRLNGGRVGDHVLAPEWTDYHKRLRYQEYDVTDMMEEGANVLGAQVANGWYAGHIGNGGYQYWGKSPALLAQLELVYQDGSRDRIITDDRWKSAASPLLATDFMLGESYDATKEVAGWDRPGFDDSAWQPVVEREVPSRPLDGQVMEPVRELMELAPKSLSEPKPGKWTYDLGQNMVGVVRLRVTAPAGTEITLRHGEMLNPDGTLYTANLRGAPSIDTYVCKGGGEEVWQPKFTFHGFQYVELTGLPEKPPLEAVTGVVIGSDTPLAGTFACSDGRVNQLQSNIEWGQRGNYLSVPTDCPQRDERLGWMGDAQVFVKTATYNSDVAAFYTKWLVDVTDSQDPSGRFDDVAPFAGPSRGTPAWGDAGVICPWTIYQTYGDLRLLERQYPSMAAWVDYCTSKSSGFIRTGDRGSDYGDWLSIAADTDKELIGTAYHAYSASLVAKAAAALGKEADAARFNRLFESIKQAFISRYVTAGGEVKGGTQCAYLLALRFDLLPAGLREAAANHLEQDILAKDCHLSTGFVGVSYLLPELTKAGKLDTAYRLLLQDTFPSWLFSVKMGATTIWERWDGWTPDRGFQNVIMNSFNHYSLGSCGEWLYRTVAGIGCDPATPGYERIVIRPQPGKEIPDARGSHRTIHGWIRSAWTRGNGNFALAVEIPVNTRATVHLPATDAAEIRESGRPLAEADGVKFLRMEDGAAVMEVGSGRYRFTANDRPLPGEDQVSAIRGSVTRLATRQLMENDGPGWRFHTADATSVHGGTVRLAGEWLEYHPAAGSAQTDSFDYTIRDSGGGVATRTVRITLPPAG